MKNKEVTSMEFKTVNIFLYPLSSEVSQMRISQKCDEMADEGWFLYQSNIIDDYNIMLIFKKVKANTSCH